MAAPQLAIAKAALSASLFRADPTSLSRPSVEAFFSLLDAATTQCSRPNVQKCRAWIVDYITPSTARSTALGKYLVALSKSLEDYSGPKPSSKRRRLHLLLILNDALHHTVTQHESRAFEQALQAHVPHLFSYAAAFPNCPKHSRKLEQLVQLWEDKAYVSSALLPKLREALSGGVSESDSHGPQTAAGSTSLKIAKEAPYVLPSQHGDASTPWFDLPASTWLPHLTPNSARPVAPDLIKPIQLSSGPADKALTEAVQALLLDVDRIFSKGKQWDTSDKDSHRIETNPLGEMILLDEITGDIVNGETYYGWSRQFCEKMKERQRKAKRGYGNDRRSRSRSTSYDSRGRSMSSSTPALKRRRRSSSVSSGRSRPWGFARDPRPSGRSPRDDSRAGFKSRSRSRSSSRSGRRIHDDRRSSPDRRPVFPDQRPPMPLGHSQTSDVPPLPHLGFPPIPPPGAFPLPPPPPAGYDGPWPPPPPPLPAGGAMPNWLPTPVFIPPGMGGWNSTGPPPPPPPHPQRPTGSGTGYQSSRGEYTRGRGRGKW